MIEAAGNGGFFHLGGCLAGAPAWEACKALGEELVHLARDREAAERWLANNRYSRADLEEGSADEVGADIIEGRTGA